MTLDLVYTITSDNLRLPGIHFIPQTKTDTCLLIVHGMSGNILENYWGDVLGRETAKAGIACIFSHNRGYGMISDPSYIDPNSHQPTLNNLRAGVVYERFTDCVLDIAAWVEHARNLGYSKVVLLGHSLGASKVIRYLYDRKPTSVQSLVLASGADMVGNGETDSNFSELYQEAKLNIQQGHPDKLTSKKIWNWYYLSSQTFIDLFTENSPVDVLPIKRNPQVFPELTSFTIPILNIIGEHDDIIMHSLNQDLEILKSKAANCPKFTNAVIPKADHNYQGCELQLASTVIQWLKNL